MTGAVARRYAKALFALGTEQGSFESTGDEVSAVARAFAERVNRLIAEPGLARAMGQAGRRRVIEHFSWPAIAEQTVGVYEASLASA